MSNPVDRYGHHCRYVDPEETDTDLHMLPSQTPDEVKPTTDLFSSVKQMKKYSYEDLSTLLQLPIIHKPKYLIISTKSIMDPSLSVEHLQRMFTSELHPDEKSLFTKCIHCYNNLYPIKNLSYDLRTYPDSLDNILQLLFRIKDIDKQKLLMTI